MCFFDRQAILVSINMQQCCFRPKQWIAARFYIDPLQKDTGTVFKNCNFDVKSISWQSIFALSRIPNRISLWLTTIYISPFYTFDMKLVQPFLHVVKNKGYCTTNKTLTEYGTYQLYNFNVREKILIYISPYPSCQRRGANYPRNANDAYRTQALSSVMQSAGSCKLQIKALAYSYNLKTLVKL